MCSIDWCGFTWQVFATMFTGILAVGAAYRVGNKQTEIQRLKLKSDLFDRRYKVYVATRDFLISRLTKSNNQELVNTVYAYTYPEERFLFGELSPCVI